MRRLSLSLTVLILLSLLLILIGGCAAISRSWDRLTQAPKPSFRRLSPAIAYEVTRDAPSVLILDLRRPEEFQGETGHLPHAWNVPLSRLAREVPQLLAYREDTLLVYCRGGDTCGEEGVKILTGAGFEDAMLIEGGIDAWIRQGFKTVLSLSH